MRTIAQAHTTPKTVWLGWASVKHSECTTITDKIFKKI